MPTSSMAVPATSAPSKPSSALVVETEVAPAWLMNPRVAPPTVSSWKPPKAPSHSPRIPSWMPAVGVAAGRRVEAGASVAVGVIVAAAAVGGCTADVTRMSAAVAAPAA